MLVSILMPMRNAEAYVAEALQSILSETSVPIEIVIVDDGSTDRSREVVLSFNDPRIRLIRKPARGVAATFNTALRQSRGDIIMRCDADDLYAAGRIPRQVEWLVRHPEYGAVCGGFSAIGKRGGRPVPFEMPAEGMDITAQLRSGKALTHFCTFAVRGAILKATGGCREFFVTGSDIDLQLRLSEQCRIWYEPGENYLWRLHDSSIIHRPNNNAFFDECSLLFQRQRLSTGKDDLQRGCPPAKPPTKSRAVLASAHLQGVMIGRGLVALSDGHRAEAIRLSFRAALMRPTSLVGWRNFAAVSLKASTRNYGPKPQPTLREGGFEA
jgi:glycosyltransferase involved in cell wall biosynthesis